MEKRLVIYGKTHSFDAICEVLRDDEIVPSRTGELYEQYPFLIGRLTDAEQLEYDNATFYENARWLILTMAEMLNPPKNATRRKPDPWGDNDERDYDNDDKRECMWCGMTGDDHSLDCPENDSPLAQLAQHGYC